MGEKNNFSVVAEEELTPEVEAETALNIGESLVR